jgi:hypothetical protein
MKPSSIDPRKKSDKALWVCSYSAFGRLNEVRNIDAA